MRSCVMSADFRREARDEACTDWFDRIDCWILFDIYVRTDFGIYWDEDDLNDRIPIPISRQHLTHVVKERVHSEEGISDFFSEIRS